MTVMNESYTDVRKEFGEGGAVDRKTLIAILQEVDPQAFKDEIVGEMLDNAGMGPQDQVPLDSFLGWIFQSQPSTQDGATQVFFCRHGETEWNVDRKMQGVSDIALTETGEKQAQCIADALKSRSLAAVWASPMQRARDTAQAIAKAVGVEVHVEDRLRERNLGVMEGRTGTEVEESFPQVWEAWKALEDLPPESEAEPEEEVVKRVESALFDIAAAYPGQSVAMVAHGAVLRCLLKQSSNCGSISTFVVGPGPFWEPVKLDDGSHLKSSRAGAPDAEA